MIGHPLDKIKKWVKKKLITYLVWDFDGTLYSNPLLGDTLRDAYVSFLNRHQSKHFTLEQFEKQCKKYGSWSATVAALTRVPESEIILTIESSIDKSEYVEPDKKIVAKLTQLTKYSHIILSNSPEEQVMRGLQKIGFKKKKNTIYPFLKIIGSDSIPELKPSQKAFEYVHRLTKAPKIRHLMIGDSYHHDIKPAREYGFQAAHITELHLYV